MRMSPNEFDVETAEYFEPEPYHEPILIPQIRWPLVVIMSPLILLYWIVAVTVFGALKAVEKAGRSARRR